MITAAASAMFAGGAPAQSTDTMPAEPGMGGDITAPDAALTPDFNAIDEMTVGDIIGRKVYEPTGDTIGKIDYIVARNGGADAVVGIGGFLGLGKYSVALPLDEFTYDAEQRMVKLDTTQDALKEQPEFDTSDVEGLPDETPLSSLIANADSSGTSDIDTGADMDTGTDMGTGSDVDTGVDTGTDMGTGADVDTGADTGADMGTGADVDTGAGIGADMGTGADVDTGSDIGDDTNTAN